MDIRKGTIAIDSSAEGTDRLVLVKNPLLSITSCGVRSLAGIVRSAEKESLIVLMQAPKRATTVNQAINSLSREKVIMLVRRLLEELR